MVFTRKTGGGIFSKFVLLLNQADLEKISVPWLLDSLRTAIDGGTCNLEFCLGTT